MKVTTSIQYLFLSRLSAFLLASFSFCILRIESKHILFANSKLFFCFSVIITFKIIIPRCITHQGIRALINLMKTQPSEDSCL